MLSLLGILFLQLVSGQFFPPPANPVPPFPGVFPGGPAFDQAATDEKYQPGKCLAANVTSNLVEFGRCIREIIDPISSSEGARSSSFQEIYEMLSFRLFGQPPQVSFEQPPGCRKLERSGESRIYVRLVDLNGDTNRDKGRVQVSMDNNNWGSICDDSWDDRDAEVVCKTLGHTYNSNSRKPISIGGGASRPGSPRPGPFGLSAFMCTLMDAVDCIGWESNLGQCGWISNSPSRCNHYEDAAVDCKPGYNDYREFNTMLYRDVTRQNCMIEQDRNRRAREQRNIEVRLVEGKRKGNKIISGRVEVRSRAGWGSVCDDDFDDDDAMVICRQLRSLSEDRRRKPRAYLMGAFGSMNQDACISMDDVHCAGSEDNLGKCHHSGATGHNCQHNEDAAVDCNTYPYDAKLESETQTTAYTVGVLMVSNDDRETYGAVTDCFDFPTWNEAATQVARKRLRNVPRDCTAVWVTDTCMEDFKRSDPPTPLMHQVVCNSTADDLGMCEFQPRLAAFTTCPSTLAIGLFCTNSGRSLPRGCQAVGSRMPLQLGPPGFNDTFGPQLPFGSPFGPPGMIGGQFGAPPPMFPGFNRTQPNSPFPGPQRQAFPPLPFQPGFQPRVPGGVGPGRLGNSAKRK